MTNGHANFNLKARKVDIVIGAVEPPGSLLSSYSVGDDPKKFKASIFARFEISIEG